MNGDDPLHLTRNSSGFAGTPRWSSDGKWIAFDYRITAHSQIFMVDAEGRNLHAVTAGDYENDLPSWSRDGASIYFASNRTGSWQVWKRKVGTGEETQVTRNGGLAAFESYDRKVLYYSRFDGAGIWSIPVAGGAEQLVTDALHRHYWGHFAVTDGGIYLLDAYASPRPTVMYLSFLTKRLTQVFQIMEHPLGWGCKPLRFARRTHAVVCATDPEELHHDGGQPSVRFVASARRRLLEPPSVNAP